MANYQVDLSALAINNINEIIDYLDSQKSGLGHDFAVEVSDFMSRMEINSGIYQKVDARVHKGQLGKFKYLAFYQVEGAIVEVLEVAHSSSNSKYLK